MPVRTGIETSTEEGENKMKRETEIVSRSCAAPVKILETSPEVRCLLAVPANLPEWTARLAGTEAAFWELLERCWLSQACDHMNQLEQKKSRINLQGSFSSPSPKGRICHWKRFGEESSQIESVWWSHRSSLLKCHGWWERGTNTQQISMVKIEKCFIWGRESWDEWLKVGPCCQREMLME